VPADDLGWLDAVALRDLVVDGEVTPGELAESAIARIDAANPVLNAVVVPRSPRRLGCSRRSATTSSRADRRGCSTRSSRRTTCDPPAGSSSTCWTGSRPRSDGP
jgi:amidase